MMDECVGHMIERVVIPAAEEIELHERRMYDGPKEGFRAFEPTGDLVPLMVRAGDGYRIHVTGLTHDERGYPDMSVAVQSKLVRRLVDKIRLHVDEIVRFDEEGTGDADIVVVTYGITSRTAIPAIEQARAKGMKVGHLRLVVVWPFPEKRIQELGGRAQAFVVPELNLGQMVHEVERCVAGRSKVLSVPHAGGTVHQPKDIYTAIEKALK
jgi:2-oxoglutarate ferredoxin oxidoreductase subunit alpha